MQLLRLSKDKRQSSEKHDSSSKSRSKAEEKYASAQPSNKSAALAGRVSPKASDVPGSRLKTALSWCTSKTALLQNTGSVARDHLANERTFLAWLRTSITLASIGIVIAQLFRLSSSRYTLPSDFGEVTANLTESSNTSIPNADIPLVLARLLAASERQEEILTSLQAAQVNEKSRYARLGRPVGATFLMISVIFVFLAIHRYLSVQHFLVNNNYFPPARRSIILAALMILALAATTFSLLFILR